MKTTLRRAFQPLLTLFESGNSPFNYKSSHRKALLGVAALFLVLSAVSATAAIVSSDLSGLLPFLIFFLLSMVCAVVGLLGNDRAVSKIWGNK